MDLDQVSDMGLLYKLSSTLKLRIQWWTASLASGQNHIFIKFYQHIHLFLHSLFFQCLQKAYHSNYPMSISFCSSKWLIFQYVILYHWLFLLKPFEASKHPHHCELSLQCH
ncbi:hypothetical protein ERO13_D05G135950v2 [Gossypium hirsutum]|uniref:Uncharacterized protein n=1 Tax=Gossypium tomentosum TaxID=34277 RepID=A0A5D2KV71_GOSTO|nr:hypothetical protein ERO13_D05G135950v2 [Gossypium hirsutum]TYH70870.1 hypothetical protein ES332_D05G146800v1 [Gossypium tomentosum]